MSLSAQLLIKNLSKILNLPPPLGEGDRKGCCLHMLIFTSAQMFYLNASSLDYSPVSRSLILSRAYLSEEVRIIVEERV